MLIASIAQHIFSLDFLCFLVIILIMSPTLISSFPSCGSGGSWDHGKDNARTIEIETDFDILSFGSICRDMWATVAATLLTQLMEPLWRFIFLSEKEKENIARGSIENPTLFSIDLLLLLPVGLVNDCSGPLERGEGTSRTLFCPTVGGVTSWSCS